MKRAIIAILFALVLTSCVTRPAPTEVPAATNIPTEEPQPTPQPTEVPAPTDTLVEPTSMPTATPAPTPAPIEPAEYQLTFDATWSAATHPTGFPPNPHFSGLIGAAHTPEARLWQMGEMASPGIKNMAETGGKSPLDAEIDAMIDASDACVQISGGGIPTSPGTVSVTFAVSEECPVVSVVTMIAPSPDWFVGVSALSLLEDGAWVDEKVVELLPYDAGTDSGEAYTSPDLPTESPEPIFALEAEPFLVDGTVPSLGTFTFTRLGG